MLNALARWKSVFFGIAALLVVGLVLSRVFDPADAEGPAQTVAAQEAADVVGERARVCGAVAEVTFIQTIDGQPTFINLERAHPNQPFTAVIWADDRGRWSTPPEALYDGTDVCVTGTVRLHEGTPQIIVARPEQIQRR